MIDLVCIQSPLSELMSLPHLRHFLKHLHGEQLCRGEQHISSCPTSLSSFQPQPILVTRGAARRRSHLLAQVPGRARTSFRCRGTALARSGAGRAAGARRAPPNREIQSSACCLRTLRLSRCQGAGRGVRLFLPYRAAVVATSGSRSRTK